MKLCVTEFSEKKFFLPQNWEKGPKMGQNQGFFNLLENLVINFLLNLIFNGNVYYWLRSYTNPIFGKNFVPEIWAKMFSANQIAVFFNQPYLQNKLMK